MRFNTIILTLSLACSANAFAAVFFQAGDIEEGKKWPISATDGVASYYAKGNVGTVQFTCDLQGEEDNSCRGGGLTALIHSGKNFTNAYNPIVLQLHSGINGPYTWVLTDTGETNGNIKINYLCGKNVTIQCVGKKI